MNEEDLHANITISKIADKSNGSSHVEYIVCDVDCMHTNTHHALTLLDQGDHVAFAEATQLLYPTV